MGKSVRSLLLVAAGDENLDQKLSWDPDAVVLDLTDLIHPSYFEQAKELIPNQISLLGSREIFSLVRMSMEQLSDDLGAFVDAGVDALMLSGLEESSDIESVEQKLTALESERGIEVGSTKLIPYLSSMSGLFNASSIIKDSSRIIAISIGVGDMAFDLSESVDKEVFFYTGPNPRISSPEFLITRTTIMAQSKKGIDVLGVLGTTIAPGFANSDHLIVTANRSARLGIKGALTLHEEGLVACRQAFNVFSKKR